MRICRWLSFATLGALLLSTGLCSHAGAYHRTPLTEPSGTNLPTELLTNSPLKRISQDVFALGEVRLDKAKGTVSFPCSVNMAEGVVEYAIVHSTGKVHESVLKTEADPFHIHLAALLLSPKQPGALPAGMPRELAGPPIRIWVTWKVQETEHRVRLETLVSNVMTRASMTAGPWIYNGSRVVEGTFLAHRDGSIVSVISDPDALINNPRPGRDDDEIWRSNLGIVPGKGTAVEVTLELPNGHF